MVMIARVIVESIVVLVWLGFITTVLLVFRVDFGTALLTLLLAAVSYWVTLVGRNPDSDYTDKHIRYNVREGFPTKRR